MAEDLVVGAGVVVTAALVVGAGVVDAAFVVAEALVVAAAVVGGGVVVTTGTGPPELLKLIASAVWFSAYLKKFKPKALLISSILIIIEPLVDPFELDCCVMAMDRA